MSEALLKQIDKMRFNRKYSEVQTLIASSDNEFFQYLKFECSLLNKIDFNIDVDSQAEYLSQIQKKPLLQFEKIGLQLVVLSLNLSIKAPAELQQNLDHECKKILIPEESELKSLRDQPFRYRILLEILLRRALLQNEIIYIDQFLKTYIARPIDYTNYPGQEQQDKELFQIFTSKYLQFLADDGSQNYLDRISKIQAFCQLQQDKKNLLKWQKFNVMALYQIAKLILPKTGLKSNISEVKSLATVFQQNNKIVTFENFRQVFEYLMFSILLILKKKQFQMTNEKDIKKFEKKSQKPQNINNFTGALNVFSCYNYKQQIRMVRNGVNNIIGHKLSNLMIVYCNQNTKPLFLKEYFKVFNESIFNDTIFLTKLAVNLYENQEIEKCSQIVSLILENDNTLTQNHKYLVTKLAQRISHLSGKYQKSLIYSQLFAQHKENDKFIKKSSVYQDIAISLQQIANSTHIQSDRQSHLKLSLDYLLKSYEIDQKNPELCYNISLVYAQINEVNNSIFYAKKAQKLDPDDIRAIILLSNIYSANNEICKAKVLVNNLLEDRPENIFLNYYKIAILCELCVQKQQNFDKNLCVFDVDNMENFQTKNIKENNVNGIIQLMKYCIQLLFPSNQFKEGLLIQEQLPKMQKIYEDYEFKIFESYRNMIVLFLDLLLIKLEETDFSQKLLEVFENFDLNKIDKLYYDGLVQLKQKQNDRGLSCFKEVIAKDPKHLQAIVCLSTLQAENIQNIEEVENILELLIQAQELDEHPQIYYNFGLIYQLMERYDDAEKSFLKSLKICSKMPIIPFQLLNQLQINC